MKKTSYRTEQKYIINPQTASVISKRLKMCCGFDHNSDSEGFYKVSSLYFDDFNNSSLGDNIVGQINRKKYRIRIYNDKADFIRFEKKTRHNQVGKKESCLLNTEEYSNFINGEMLFDAKVKDTDLVREFYRDVRDRNLKPKVIVEYDRQTFVYAYGAVRITFDHNIRFVLGNVDLFENEKIYAPALDRRQIVMEVKYSGFLPSHIKALIQQGITMRQSISKYSLCRLRSY